MDLRDKKKKKTFKTQCCPSTKMAQEENFGWKTLSGPISVVVLGMTQGSIYNKKGK